MLSRNNWGRRSGSSGPKQGDLMIATILTALSLMVQAQPHHHRPDLRWNVVRPYNQKLERMALCESTKRWWITTYAGRDRNGNPVYYYGGLQFDLSTWRSVGGKGFPHHNSILEQKYRAVKLIKRRGYSPWPICGYF